MCRKEFRFSHESHVKTILPRSQHQIAFSVTENIMTRHVLEYNICVRQNMSYTNIIFTVSFSTLANVH